MGALGTVTKGLVQRLGNNRTSGDCPNYCIVEIGQNAGKSPVDLRRLVTQTPVRDCQLRRCEKLSRSKIMQQTNAMEV